MYLGIEISFSLWYSLAKSKFHDPNDTLNFGSAVFWALCFWDVRCSRNCLVLTFLFLHSFHCYWSDHRVYKFWYHTLRVIVYFKLIILYIQTYKMILSEKEEIIIKLCWRIKIPKGTLCHRSIHALSTQVVVEWQPALKILHQLRRKKCIFWSLSVCVSVCEAVSLTVCARVTKNQMLHNLRKLLLFYLELSMMPLDSKWTQKFPSEWKWNKLENLQSL